MSKRMRDIASEYLMRMEGHREEELVTALTAAYQAGYERGKEESFRFTSPFGKEDNGNEEYIKSAQPAATGEGK